MWFEVFREKWNIHTIFSGCVTKEFHVTKARVMELNFRASYPIIGYAGISGRAFNCDTGACELSMGDWGGSSHPFNILYTDYDNFEIYYSCTDYLWGLFKYEDLSITSRTQVMSKEVQEKVSAIL